MARLVFGCASSSGGRLQVAPLDLLACLPLLVAEQAVQSVPTCRCGTFFASSVPALHFAKHAVQHREGFHRSPGSSALAARCRACAAALAFFAAAAPLAAFVALPVASLAQRVHSLPFCCLRTSAASFLPASKAARQVAQHFQRGRGRPFFAQPLQQPFDCLFITFCAGSVPSSNACRHEWQHSLRGHRSAWPVSE